MKNRILSLFFAIILATSAQPISTSFATNTDIVRYTVLVLDTSSSSNFSHNGTVFYTADTAISYVKIAAKKFVENIQEADGVNYLAIVSFKGDSATVVSDFSTDENTLKNAIEGLSAYETTRSVAAGLQCADELISSLSNDGVIKNVVLFTTGMTNAGSYSYSGQYGDSTVGSNWRRMDTQVRLYAYANSAYSTADEIKRKANLYTIGLFQTMDGMPSQGKEIVDFFKLFTLECATSPSHFYDVKDPNDLEFIFGRVADDLKDSDGDGLPDIWERDGVTIDGQFIDLPAMGANPSVPDIFVEVDWMVEPKSTFLWFETSPETSLAPSQNAMWMVYNTFKNHGIQLHIDVGSNSTDFVTGNTWGDRSGGNEIPYESVFSIINDDFKHWNEVVSNNFDSSRSSIFRHCLFINKYDGGTSSGIANNIPGQYFVVANQKWLRNTGDTGIAGTFMHELGHTLGLCHGGHTETGEGNHTHYKPNYLSIMNYLFQTSGLVGTDAVNYSEYKLPDLDENSLDENAGIDPEGLTASTGLGTKFKRTNLFGTFEYTVEPVAYTSVDFNGWWGIDSDTVSVDLNGDGINEVLTSSNDWDHIDFKGGNLGKEYAYIAGLEGPSKDFAETLKEAQLEEFLDAGVLGNKGTGSIESIGPATVLAGTPGQYFHIRVSNLTSEDETYRLSVLSNSIAFDFSTDVNVSGSDTEIRYVDVAVPLIDNPVVGTYEITARLSNIARDDVVKTFSVNVYNPSKDEKEALINALENGELDGLLPVSVIDEYQELFNNVSMVATPVLSKAGTFADSREITITCATDGATIYYTTDGSDPTVASTQYTETFTISSTMTIKALATKDGMTNSTVASATYLKSSGGGGSGSGGSTTKTYAVKNQVASTANGKVALSSTNAAAGAKITVTVTPDQGYKLDTLTVTDASGKEVAVTEQAGKYTFTMPASEIKVNATFVAETGAAEGETAFVDVPADSFYAKAVEWAVKQGVTKGTSGTTFSPNNSCKRSEAVSFLYRAAGEPEVSLNSAFTDVLANSYYTNAVVWAVENGITNGTGDGKFSPNAVCNRAQIVTFLYRAAGEPEVSLNSTFTDVPANSYYTNAVAWAVENGITNGTGDGKFSPNAVCNRAQIVTFLYRSSVE